MAGDAVGARSPASVTIRAARLTGENVDFRNILARRCSVEYVGLCEAGLESGYRRERGHSEPVYVDLAEERRQTREYRLDAGLTLATIRFRIAVTRGGAREDMAFDVKRGVWCLFAFECPYSWQTLCGRGRRGPVLVPLA